MKQDPKPIKFGFVGETLNWRDEMSELRKCKVKRRGNPECVGLFHIWATDENGDAWAIVELLDGSIERILHCDISFIKSEEAPEIFPGTLTALNKIKI